MIEDTLNEKKRLEELLSKKNELGGNLYSEESRGIWVKRLSEIKLQLSKTAFNEEGNPIEKETFK